MNFFINELISCHIKLDFLIHTNFFVEEIINWHVLISYVIQILLIFLSPAFYHSLLISMFYKFLIQLLEKISNFLISIKIFFNKWWKSVSERYLNLSFVSSFRFWEPTINFSTEANFWQHLKNSKIELRKAWIFRLLKFIWNI
jgi:hypothetical protein